jgi:hypothetical protein
VPWALLGLLTVGTVCGSALGVAQHHANGSAQTQIAQIVAATQHAGSARFAYSTVVASSNALLRSRTSGSGVIDFVHDAMRTTESQRETSSSAVNGRIEPPTTQTVRTTQIWIHRTEYTQIAFPASVPALSPRWVKGPTLPAGDVGAAGMLGMLAPLGWLSTAGPGQTDRLERIGATTVGGHPATKYAVDISACVRSSKGRQHDVPLTTVTLWVDGDGRLIDAENSAHFDTPRPAVPAHDGVYGRATVVNTIRLYDFGLAVKIGVPPVLQGGSGSGFAIALRAACHA